jgi:hypothetical protein
MLGGFLVNYELKAGNMVQHCLVSRFELSSGFDSSAEGKLSAKINTSCPCKSESKLV